MGGRYIDLHTHTIASDGTDSPAVLAANAVRAGVAAIALTDHDTLDGLDEAGEAAAAAGLEFIRGCELAVQDDEFGELHILGLWIPARPSARMQNALRDIRDRRAARNKAIIRRLADLGMSLEPEALAAVAGRGTLGRPHMAEAMKRKGYVSGVREAFERYLGWGKAAFVPRDLYTPREAIGLLADEGATVVLAHPCLNREMDREGLDDRLSEFRALGLCAIEAYHSAHDARQTRMCVSLAKKHGLLLSGGSDYHGATKPGISLAVGKGGLRVPYLLLERMRAHRRGAGLWV